MPYLKTTLETGANVPESLSGQYGATRATFRRDTRNGPLVPTRGTLMELRGSRYDRYPCVRRDFPVYEGMIQKSHPSIRSIP